MKERGKRSVGGQAEGNNKRQRTEQDPVKTEAEMANYYYDSSSKFETNDMTLSIISDRP